MFDLFMMRIKLGLIAFSLIDGDQLQLSLAEYFMPRMNCPVLLLLKKMFQWVFSHTASTQEHVRLCRLTAFPTAVE
jgi:hypothetical protein